MAPFGVNRRRLYGLLCWWGRRVLHRLLLHRLLHCGHGRSSHLQCWCCLPFPKRIGAGRVKGLAVTSTTEAGLFVWMFVKVLHVPGELLSKAAVTKDHSTGMWLICLWNLVAPREHCPHLTHRSRCKDPSKNVSNPWNKVDQVKRRCHAVAGAATADEFLPDLSEKASITAPRLKAQGHVGAPAVAHSIPHLTSQGLRIS